MSAYNKFYFVGGKVFKEKSSVQSLIYARHFAKENGIKEQDIYELHNDTELAYLRHILEQGARNILTHINHTHIGDFTNRYGELIPKLTFDLTFEFNDMQNYHHWVMIAHTPYDLNKELIFNKTLFDYCHQEYYSMEVYYLKNNEWVEWHIGDKTEYIEMRKENHKRLLAQKRVIRDRQKYDRLMKLRSEGKITDKQTKELYRLDKVFGGK